MDARTLGIQLLKLSGYASVVATFSCLGGSPLTGVLAANLAGNVATGLMTNCADKFGSMMLSGDSGGLLDNHDLTKAAFQAIATCLEALAAGAEKPKGGRRAVVALAELGGGIPWPKEHLEEMANTAKQKWEVVLNEAREGLETIEVVDKEAWLRAIALQRGAAVSLLDEEVWVGILREVTYKSSFGMNELPQDADFRALATVVQVVFPRALREVLKADFKAGGQAFAGVVIDGLGTILSELRELQAGAPEMALAVNELRECFQEEASERQDFLARLSEVIDEGYDAFSVQLSLVDERIESIVEVFSGNYVNSYS